MSAQDAELGRLDGLAMHLGRVMASVATFDWTKLCEDERVAIADGLASLMVQLGYQLRNDLRMAQQEGRLAEQVRRQAALDLELADLRERIERLEKGADHAKGGA